MTIRGIRAKGGRCQAGEKALSELGLRIVRFGNDEVVRNVSAVVGRIRELISA